MAIVFVDGTGCIRTARRIAAALPAAFAPIDRRAAEVAGSASVGQLLYLFLTTYLAEDILTKTDRASMFNGLKVRAPFFGRRFAEYALSLTSRLKLRGWDWEIRHEALPTSRSI